MQGLHIKTRFLIWEKFGFWYLFGWHWLLQLLPAWWLRRMPNPFYHIGEDTLQKQDPWNNLFNEIFCLECKVEVCLIARGQAPFTTEDSGRRNISCCSHCAPWSIGNGLVSQRMGSKENLDCNSWDSNPYLLAYFRWLHIGRQSVHRGWATEVMKRRNRQRDTEQEQDCAVQICPRNFVPLRIAQVQVSRGFWNA